MKKENFQGLVISVSIFLVCLVIVEIFLWFFAPVPDPYEKYYSQLNQYITWPRKPNERIITELETELPGADGENVFTTNNMGFRGDFMAMPKPDNEFRVFILGASNAESFYLDDSESLEAVLQKELNNSLPPELSVKVYNAGQTAYNSDDIISMIVHRVVHLEPDMFIVFSADLFAPIRDYDYLHYVKDAPKKKFPLIHFLATEFQIPRRIYYFIKFIAPSEQEIFETVALKSKYIEVIEKFRATPVSDIEPKTNLPAFSINLRTIIGVTRANKVRLVFMTPQSTWNSEIDPGAKDFHWALYYNGVRYQEDLMHRALESYNDVMRRLSEEYSVPLYDLARTIPKSREYFFDDFHFNTKGAAFTGKELAAFLLSRGIIGR